MRSLYSQCTNDTPFYKETLSKYAFDKAHYTIETLSSFWASMSLTVTAFVDPIIQGSVEGTNASEQL